MFVDTLARHCEVRSNLFATQSRSAYVEIASYLAKTRGEEELALGIVVKTPECRAASISSPE